MQSNNSNCKSFVRQRINEKLDDSANFPITIISAPMGFGKTIAVRDFLNSGNHQFLWVTMSEAINIAPEEYFWYLVTRKLISLSPELAELFQNWGFPADSVQILRIIDKVRDMPLAKPLFVIIDDYYLIENTKINYLIECFAKAVITNFHLIIITRHSLSRTVTELSFKNLCLSIKAPDIAYTDIEIREYLMCLGINASEELFAKICKYANGWITAVYIMARNYLEHGYLNVTNSLYAMIHETLYSKYSNVIKYTLLKLSMFDSFSIPQAEYVLENPEISNILSELSQKNAFITHSSDGIYRFQQIFLDFLRDERKKSGIDINNFIERTGQWYANNGNHWQALQCWLIVKDYDRIFEELENSNISRISCIDKDLLFQIFHYAEEDIMHKYPLATLKYIFFYSLHIDKQMGIQMLEKAMKYYETHSPQKYSSRRMLAECHLMYTAVVFNDCELLIEHCRKAKELFDGKSSMVRTQNSILTYGLPHFTYAYFRKSGEFQSTVRTLLDGFDVHVNVTGGCGAGFEYVATAEYSLETGDFTTVEANAKKAIYKAQKHNQICIIICAKLTLGRLYLYQNRLQEFDDLLNELISLAKTEQYTLNLNVLDNAIGYLAACRGKIDLIPHWLKTGDIKNVINPYNGCAFNDIIYGKALFLSGNYMELEVMTESFYDDFSYFNNQLGFIHNHIHNALAKYHLYGLNMGVKKLDEALSLGEKDNIVMPFVENGTYILPMLKTGFSMVSQKYINQILNLIEKNEETASACPTKDQHTGLLSSREIEVLRSMARGLSQKSIASQLFISENTVKRHTQNIYQKLGVNNKTLAISRFQELFPELM